MLQANGCYQIEGSPLIKATVHWNQDKPKLSSDNSGNASLDLWSSWKGLVWESESDKSSGKPLLMYLWARHWANIWVKKLHDKIYNAAPLKGVSRYLNIKQGIGSKKSNAVF